MAGLAGFEPAHDGIKTRCLTAWRQPIKVMVKCLALVRQNLTIGLVNF